MKNEAIGRLLKREGRAIVMSSWGETGEVERQYISDGCAVYPVDERLPVLEEPAIRLIYKLPEDEDKLSIRERPLPEWMAFDDIKDYDESFLRQSKLMLVERGKTYIPLVDIRGRGWLLDAAYLAPLADMDDVILYIREREHTQPMIAACRGLETWALIAPVMADNDMLRELRAVEDSLPWQVADGEEKEEQLEMGDDGAE